MKNIGIDKKYTIREVEAKWKIAGGKMENKKLI